MDVLAVEVFDYLFPDTAQLKYMTVLAVRIIQQSLLCTAKMKILTVLAVKISAALLIENRVNEDIWMFSG